MLRRIHAFKAASCLTGCVLLAGCSSSWTGPADDTHPSAASTGSHGVAVTARSSGRGTPWSGVDRLGGGQGGGGPRLAVGRDGIATAAWQSHGIRLRQSSQGKSWGRTELVPGSRGGRVYLLGIGVDRDGTVTAVWKRALRLWASDRVADGRWSRPQLISTGGFGGDLPHVDFSASGAAIVAWNQAGSIAVVYRRPDGAWDERTSLPVPDSRAYSAEGSPAVAMGSGGVASVAYLRGRRSSTPGHARWLDLAQRGRHGWRTRLTLDTPATDYLSVALDAANGRDVHLAWSDRERATGLLAVRVAHPAKGDWVQGEISAPPDRPIELLDVVGTRDGSALVAWVQGGSCSLRGVLMTASVTPSGEVDSEPVPTSAVGRICSDPVLRVTPDGAGLLSWAQHGRVLTALRDASSTGWGPVVDTGATLRDNPLPWWDTAMGPNQSAMIAWTTPGARQTVARHTDHAGH